MFQLAVALLQLLKEFLRRSRVCNSETKSKLDVSMNVSKLFHYFIGYFPLLSYSINDGLLLPITVSLNCALFS